MGFIPSVTDILCIGIAISSSILLLRSRNGRWITLGVIPVVLAAGMIWGEWLRAGPIARLSPIIVVMFFLPGYLLLELAFSTAAQKLGPLERAPLLFGVSIAIWTLTAAAAFRARMASDLVIGGVLGSTLAGLLVLSIIRARCKDERSVSPNHGDLDDHSRAYSLCLILVLLVVSAVVGFTAEFQRYDFDSSFHLAGYNKIAQSDTITGGNAFLGPGYSYLRHYIAHPWYLVFGLSARLAHIHVAWLYVYLAAILTPLFFLSFYFLVYALTRDRWISTIGSLLAIGPWISEMALGWGPPMGTFYLQFLPFPGTYTQLILFPIWLAYSFRYMYSQAGEDWAIAVLLAIATMGQHPVFLLIVPYCAGLLFIISLIFTGTLQERMKTLAFVAVIVTFAAAMVYWVTHPVGQEVWKGEVYALGEENFMKDLFRKAWVLSANLYALHPKLLMTLDHFTGFMGALILALIIAFQPKLLGGKIAEGWFPSSRLSTIPNKTQFRLAGALAAVFIGPYLILYNPVLVPMIIKVLGSAIPIRYIALEYEVLVLACKFGAMAGILVMVVRWPGFDRYRKQLKFALLTAILVMGLVFPLARPAVSSMIFSMFDRHREFVSILDLIDDSLYRELSKIEPGVVAIAREQAEYLVMTTPHYVVSSCRMTEERQLDNEKIVNFSVSPDGMKALVEKYHCRYVVVPLNGDIVNNGEFSKSAAHWDGGIACTIASVPDGGKGNCLQLTRKGYNEQVAYQNITCDFGKFYRLEGFVKSGTSGNEPFALQIFRQNVSGPGDYSIDGRTTKAWVGYSMIFKANDRDLCIVLRKRTPTPGTMRFDSISCYEVTRSSGAEIHASMEKDPKGSALDPDAFIPNTPLQRFRANPELFWELPGGDQYAIFEVREKNRIGK